MSGGNPTTVTLRSTTFFNDNRVGEEWEEQKDSYIYKSTINSPLGNMLRASGAETATDEPDFIPIGAIMP